MTVSRPATVAARRLIRLRCLPRSWFSNTHGSVISAPRASTYSGTPAALAESSIAHSRTLDSSGSPVACQRCRRPPGLKLPYPAAHRIALPGPRSYSIGPISTCTNLIARSQPPRDPAVETQIEDMTVVTSSPRRPAAHVCVLRCLFLPPLRFDARVGVRGIVIHVVVNRLLEVSRIRSPAPTTSRHSSPCFCHP